MTERGRHSRLLSESQTFVEKRAMGLGCVNVRRLAFVLERMIDSRKVSLHILCVLCVDVLLIAMFNCTD
jgi:hypothetical protein